MALLFTYSPDGNFSACGDISLAFLFWDDSVPTNYTRACKPMALLCKNVNHK